jgi:hypothetical protein
MTWRGRLRAAQFAGDAEAEDARIVKGLDCFVREAPEFSFSSACDFSSGVISSMGQKGGHRR